MGYARGHGGRMGGWMGEVGYGSDGPEMGEGERKRHETHEDEMITCFAATGPID